MKNNRDMMAEYKKRFAELPIKTIRVNLSSLPLVKDARLALTELLREREAVIKLLPLWPAPGETDMNSPAPADWSANDNEIPIKRFWSIVNTRLKQMNGREMHRESKPFSLKYGLLFNESTPFSLKSGLFFNEFRSFSLKSGLFFNESGLFFNKYGPLFSESKSFSCKSGLDSHELEAKTGERRPMAARSH